tara:strand:+ start:45 stop:266 length:222 start_codon:yes stop_codon:yes gene_type:complete
MDDERLKGLQESGKNNREQDKREVCIDLHHTGADAVERIEDSDGRCAPGCARDGVHQGFVGEELIHCERLSLG